MRITFGDLKIGSVARANIQKALDDNWISQGSQVKEFENKWSELFGYKHSIAMSSGTDADINSCLSLYDFGAKRGDNIICPALTFIATANAILLAGFVPKFVDINKYTLNIDESKIEESINDKTRAIMVTHTMGKPCEMDTIRQIAQKYNLRIIEDSCEAHGMKYKGEYTGKISDVSTFSFYTAHIVVAGEGGMCSTDDDEIANILRSTRSHGRIPGTDYFDHVRFGLNSKMTDLCAAIGLESLDNFHEIIDIRRRNKDILFQLLSDIEEYFIMYHEEPHEFISPHAFPIVFREDKTQEYEKFYSYLQSNGIQCKTLFSSVPTQQKSFGFMGHNIGEFPDAEYVGRNGLHFGIHQYLTEDDMQYISDILHKWVLR